MVGSGGLGRCVSQVWVGIESTKYEIRNRNQCRMSKGGTMYQEPACGRQAKYKVGIRIGIEVLVFKDLGTSYLVLST